MVECPKYKETENRDRRYNVQKNRVLATRNKWAIENFKELNKR